MCTIIVPLAFGITLSGSYFEQSLPYMYCSSLVILHVLLKIGSCRLANDDDRRVKSKIQIKCYFMLVPRVRHR